MINLLKASLVLMIMTFGVAAYSVSHCESYSHVQLAEKYSANFLKKDFQGCFSYSVDPANRTPDGSLWIRLGDHLTNLPKGEVAKIAFAAFTSLTDTIKTNKAISNNVDTNLNNIRINAIESSSKIAKDLHNFKDVYANDAIKQFQVNQQKIKNDSSLITARADKIKSESAKISVASEVSSLPGSFNKVVQNVNEIEKEKGKWDQFKQLNSMPFRSLEKIKMANNEALAGQLLKEIKNARYNKLGLTKDENLPLLKSVQQYEGKENLYNQKLSIINNNPELTSPYSNDQVRTIKAIAQEFKKESEQELVNGELDSAHDSIDMAYVALDIATSLPIIASGRGLYELYTGKSLIDGHSLDKIETSIAAAMLLIDLTPASVITRGGKIINTIGKVGTRLAEKGIVKIGLEEALHQGAKYADLVGSTVSSLIAKGAIKYSTAKAIVEHKLFFKYIDEEAFLNARLAYDVLTLDVVAATLIEEGVDLSPSLLQYLENAVHYDLTNIRSPQSTIRTAKEYLRLERIYPELNNIGIKNLEVTRASKFLPFDTNINWQRANMNTTHRATMQGDIALYTVIGSGANAKNAARAELELAPELLHDLYLDTKMFSAEKVLDLTDPHNLEKLGINMKALVEQDTMNKYVLPQMLGHLAKMNNYDAIIFQGTKRVLEAETELVLDAYQNLILLKGY